MNADVFVFLCFLILGVAVICSRYYYAKGKRGLSNIIGVVGVVVFIGGFILVSCASVKSEKLLEHSDNLQHVEDITTVEVIDGESASDTDYLLKITASNKDCVVYKKCPKALTEIVYNADCNKIETYDVDSKVYYHGIYIPRENVSRYKVYIAE